MGGETPGSVVSYKAPPMDTAKKRSPRSNTDEQKMIELRRLRKESKKAESIRVSQTAFKQGDGNGGEGDSPWLR